LLLAELASASVRPNDFEAESDHIVSKQKGLLCSRHEGGTLNRKGRSGPGRTGRCRRCRLGWHTGHAGAGRKGEQERDSCWPAYIQSNKNRYNNSWKTAVRACRAAKGDTVMHVGCRASKG